MSNSWRPFLRFWRALRLRLVLAQRFCSSSAAHRAACLRWLPVYKQQPTRKECSGARRHVELRQPCRKSFQISSRRCHFSTCTAEKLCRKRYEMSNTCRKIALLTPTQADTTYHAVIPMHLPPLLACADSLACIHPATHQEGVSAMRVVERLPISVPRQYTVAIAAQTALSGLATGARCRYAGHG
jgi:hypothetical protein